MKRLIALATLGFALTAGSHAQSASAPTASAVSAAKQAKVERLFDAMHIERSSEQMMGLMRQMIVQATQNAAGMSTATPEQKKLVSDYQDKAMQLAIDAVGWKAMKSEYVKIYATDFTDEQLDAMIAFYTSPAGKALLDKTPEITQQTMGAVQQRMATLQPQVRQLMEDLASKLKATTPASPKSGK